MGGDERIGQHVPDLSPISKKKTTNQKRNSRIKKARQNSCRRHSCSAGEGFWILRRHTHTEIIIITIIEQNGKELRSVFPPNWVALTTVHTGLEENPTSPVTQLLSFSQGRLLLNVLQNFETCLHHRLVSLSVKCPTTNETRGGDFNRLSPEPKSEIIKDYRNMHPTDFPIW